VRTGVKTISAVGTEPGINDSHFTAETIREFSFQADRIDWTGSDTTTAASAVIQNGHSHKIFSAIGSKIFIIVSSNISGQA
jgi:hypothetical protein